MTTIKRFTPDYKMHAVRFEAFAREAEHGELVRFDAHQQVVSALEAERDALAVERDAARIALASIYKTVTGELPEWSNWHAYLDDIVEEVGAALAAIQAQGVEKYASDLDQIASESNPAEPKHTVASSYADDARSFAKNLREAK
ncbi:hypothetical protein QZQ04_10255 [Serratia marcescens]|uniref:hypothetical protein n=1 Tax=Serratia TaxID=613 RepID=UPI00193405FD|nr:MULTISPECIES: hypothetical protein [Serratia]MBM0400843.1 hypothetical protein [Serratia sp. 4542]MDP8635125.1 hypothetical protein [Serratia marcescens]MDP8868625.1 hypothetical protein [Serratia marcescens]